MRFFAFGRLSATAASLAVASSASTALLPLKPEAASPGSKAYSEAPGSSISCPSSSSTYLGSISASGSGHPTLGNWIHKNLLPFILVHACAETAAPHATDLPALLNSDPSAAVALAVAGQSASIMKGVHLNAQELAAFSDAACKHMSLGVLATWEVTTLAWGLACLGAPASPGLITVLRLELERACKGGAALQDIAVQVWSLAVLGGLTQEDWVTALKSIRSRSISDFDEAVLMFLLLAIMFSPDPRQQQQVGLRKSRVEVEAFIASAGGLPNKVITRLLGLYDAYVPVGPHIEGPFMAILYMIMVAPNLACAIAGNELKASTKGLFGSSTNDTSIPAASTSPGCFMQRVLGPRLVHASSRFCDGTAAAAVRSPHELARVRRDIDFHCRHEARERTANEVVYLLKHKLGISSLTQPADVDVAVPQVELAIVIDEAPGPTSAGEAPAGPPVDPLDTGAASLCNLFHTRFSPSRIVSARGAACPGVGKAKIRAMEQRGWRVQMISVAQWQALDEKNGGMEKKAAFLRALLG